MRKLLFGNCPYNSWIMQKSEVLLVMQWVKDPVLSLQHLQSLLVALIQSLAREFHMPQGWQKKKKKKIAIMHEWVDVIFYGCNFTEWDKIYTTLNNWSMLTSPAADTMCFLLWCMERNSASLLLIWIIIHIIPAKNV